MDIDPSVVIATMINFVIFILILKHFFWDKIQKVIQERQDYIEEQLDKAEEILKKLDYI